MLELARQRLADLFAPGQEIARGVEQVVEIEQRGGVFVGAPIVQQPVHRSGDAREKLACDTSHEPFERGMAGQILRVRRVIRLDAFGLWSAGLSRRCLPLAFGLQYPRATGLSETALRLRGIERRDQRAIGRSIGAKGRVVQLFGKLREILRGGVGDGLVKLHPRELSR